MRTITTETTIMRYLLDRYYVPYVCDLPPLEWEKELSDQSKLCYECIGVIESGVVSVQSEFTGVSQGMNRGKHLLFQTLIQTGNIYRVHYLYTSYKACLDGHFDRVRWALNHDFYDDDGYDN